MTTTAAPDAPAETYVILPDGNLEKVPASLVPDDVPMIPLHPEADFGDWLLPAHEPVLRLYRRGRYDLERLLHLQPHERITVERKFGAKYGDLPSKERFQTPLDAIKAGRVIEIDGAPIYPVVSRAPRPQAAYRERRRLGDKHDVAYQIAAREEARRQLRSQPFEDGDYIIFGSPGSASDYPISRDFDVQVRYWQMRFRGQSHNLAEMLATRSFPGVKTDATFNHGRCNGNQFETHPALGDQYRRLADAAGVSTTGKFYSSGLADFPGDPTAWVSDRGDVLRVARLKGMRVRGDVEHDPGEREPMPDVPIAPEIVKGFVDDYMTQDTGERRADVEERFTRLLTGEVDDNPLLVQDPPANIDL
jgi:hypothetical protein